MQSAVPSTVYWTVSLTAHACASSTVSFTVSLIVSSSVSFAFILPASPRARLCLCILLSLRVASSLSPFLAVFLYVCVGLLVLHFSLRLFACLSLRLSLSASVSLRCPRSSPCLSLSASVSSAGLCLPLSPSTVSFSASPFGLNFVSPLCFFYNFPNNCSIQRRGKPWLLAGWLLMPHQQRQQQQ